MNERNNLLKKKRYLEKLIKSNTEAIEEITKTISHHDELFYPFDYIVSLKYRFKLNYIARKTMKHIDELDRLLEEL